MKKHINKILSIIILSAVVLSSFAMYSCREPEKQEKKYEASVVYASILSGKADVEVVEEEYPEPSEEIEVEFNGDTYVCKYSRTEFSNRYGGQTVHHYEGVYDKYNKNEVYANYCDKNNFKNETMLVVVSAKTGAVIEIYANNSLAGSKSPELLEEFKFIDGGYEALRRRADEIAIQYGATSIEDYYVQESERDREELKGTASYQFTYGKLINGCLSTVDDYIKIVLLGNGDIYTITVFDAGAIQGGPDVYYDEDTKAMGKALSEKMAEIYGDQKYIYQVDSKKYVLLDDGSLGAYYFCNVGIGDVSSSSIDSDRIHVLVREAD